MFTVYHSNQVDVLKSLLVALIRREPLNNPFETEQIVVQSSGMSQWLKIEQAKELGISANLSFSQPASFIWQCFTQILPNIPQRSAFNKEAMTWQLMQLLPSQLERPEFSPLKQYLNDDTDNSKRYQLAEKIADIFDGYLVYRPEWIRAWELGQTVDEIDGEQPWQALLWQELYQQILNLGQSEYHRANLYERFIAALDPHNTSVSISDLPSRLFIFGITSLPPRYLDALYALGQHIDVHIMFTNPCRYYWGDIRDRSYIAKIAAKQRKKMQWQVNISDASELISDELVQQLKGPMEWYIDDADNTEQSHDAQQGIVGNSLLASMGKLGRDNLLLLSQLNAQEVDAFVDIEPNNLLEQIQSDILELAEYDSDSQTSEWAEGQAQIEPKDTSFQLHVCHNAMREVEVLHDRLLAMFDADPSLKPKDIIVMVADINAYSHAIQAVFGNAPYPRYIPFSISDRSAELENPILQAFLRLITLPNSRCPASELLELLEVPAVMARFGIAPVEFEQITLWVKEVGIRWGTDDQSMQDFDLPAQKQNTWLFGIERMLLGYALPEQAGLFYPQYGQSDANTDAILAFDEVQGMDAELAGKLANFISKVRVFRDNLSDEQPFLSWKNHLFNLLDSFFVVDLEGEGALTTIRTCLQQLDEQLLDANMQEELSPQIMQQYLTNSLSNSRIDQRFLAGQVNFCTLMPMRSIPFKTVCLLGMNDGLYPRVTPPESFDLMNTHVRAGDRSRRNDDRYLFLEALLSAQQYLYISYVGRSSKDNSIKEPSILVAELLEYCDQSYVLTSDSKHSVTEFFTHHQPMVPYSSLAFDSSDPYLASYAKEWLPVAHCSDQLNQGEQTQSDPIQSDPIVSEFIQPLDPYLSQLEADALHGYSLSLSDLHSFWRLPVKYFFNKRLKVYFDSFNSDSQQDDEPFTLNNLDAYLFGAQVLDKWLHGQHQDKQYPEKQYPEEQYQEEQHRERQGIGEFLQHHIELFKATGGLPLSNFGVLEGDKLNDKFRLLAEELTFYTDVPMPDIEVDLRFDIDGKNHRLTGWLSGAYKDKLIRYRSGSIHSSNWFATWIDHLCLNASGHKSVTHVFGISKGEVQHRSFEAINASVAHNHLHNLMVDYYQGMDKPLLFMPKTVIAGIEQGFKPPTKNSKSWVGFEEGKKEAAIKKMSEAYHDGYIVAGEGNDTYISRVWKEWNDDIADSLLSIGEQHIQPMLAADKNELEEEEKA